MPARISKAGSCITTETDGNLTVQWIIHTNFVITRMTKIVIGVLFVAVLSQIGMKIIRRECDNAPITCDLLKCRCLGV